jgi:hypothetical protein
LLLGLWHIRHKNLYNKTANGGLNLIGVGKAIVNAKSKAKALLYLRFAVCKPQLNSSTTDKRIATQRCSTGVAKAGIIIMNQNKNQLAINMNWKL